MGNSKYISLVRFLLFLDVDVNAPLNISRIRKQVIAEFAIAENGIIQIDNFTYNKNDVLNEIDSLDFEKRWYWHKIIWDKKQILKLIEEESIDMDTIGAELNIYRKDEEFIKFFSPYFATPFNNMCRSLLYPPNFAVLEIFLKCQQFLLPQDKEVAFTSIRLFLAETHKLFKNTTRQNYEINLPELNVWKEQNWHLFFNRLPDEFDDIKYNISTKLISIMVAIQKVYPKDCALYSYELVQLQNMDPELRKIIFDNHQIFISNANPKSSSGNTFNIVRLIIFIVVIFAKIIGSGGCH